MISNRNRPVCGNRSFLEQDFYKVHDEVQVLNKFKEFFTARMLVRIDKEMNADNLKIISISDDNAKLFKPSWWQEKGICYSFDSYVGKLIIVAKVAVDSQMQVRLSSAFKHWIDFTKLTVNEKVIFDTIKPSWHDKASIYNIDVKAGEIQIQIEWQPHESNSE